MNMQERRRFHCGFGHKTDFGHIPAFITQVQVCSVVSELICNTVKRQNSYGKAKWGKMMVPAAIQ